MAKENRINAHAYSATTTVSILHMTTKPVIVPITTSLVAVIFLAIKQVGIGSVQNNPTADVQKVLFFFFTSSLRHSMYSIEMPLSNFQPRIHHEV